MADRLENIQSTHRHRKAGGAADLNGIHRLILKRLALAWAVLSILIGGAVIYLEIRRVDDLAFDLALKSSASFREHVNQIGSEHVAPLENEGRELLRQGFIAVRLYNVRQQPVLELVSSGREALVAKLARHAHPLLSNEPMHHHLHWLDREMLIIMLVPLKENNGNVNGYFEGIYQVEAATRTDIESSVLRNIGLALIVILVTAIALYPVILFLNRGVLRLSGDLMRSNIELMEVLGSAIAKRDSDTDLHNYRVCVYSIRFAEALGLTAGEIRHLIAGAFLHDVGKIGISDNILLKPGKLTEEEFAVMRTHVLLGADIIANSNWLRSACDVVEFHHEKFDGSGYMRGLRDRNIPLNARIFTIIDVFDALTTKRPYKEPFTFDEAMRIMETGSGNHFDPSLMETFRKIATTLYAEVGAKEERTVKKLMRLLLTNYYFDNNTIGLQ